MATTVDSADTSCPSLDLGSSFADASRLTQTHCLNTTVPINIKGSDIGGRHTPTKSALRHSRMIASNRRRNEAHSSNFSIIVNYPMLAKFFMCLQNQIAVIIILLSTWMFLQMPNLKHRDIPFWSGSLLLFSGLLNMSSWVCCQKSVSNYPPRWYSCYPMFFTLIVTILAAVACLFALVFAAVHVYVIKVADCTPNENQNDSCVCVVTASGNDSIDVIDVGTQTYLYPSLNCHQVTSLLVIALIGSAVANASGTVVSLYYVFLHKTSKFVHKYSHVPITDSSPLRL